MGAGPSLRVPGRRYLLVAASGAKRAGASGRRLGVGGVSAARPGAPGRLGGPAALASSLRVGGETGGRRAGLRAGRGRLSGRERHRGVRESERAPAAGGTGACLLPCEHLKPCGRGCFSPVGGGGQVPAGGAQGPSAGRGSIAQDTLPAWGFLLLPGRGEQGGCLIRWSPCASERAFGGWRLSASRPFLGGKWC